jgi:hypothetical protein
LSFLQCLCSVSIGEVYRDNVSNSEMHKVAGDRGISETNRAHAVTACISL